MSEIEIKRLKAEIVLMKWDRLRKYVNKGNLNRPARDLVDEITKDLEELSERKSYKDKHSPGELK